MSNIFASGLQTNDGFAAKPAVSFLTDTSSGIFLNSDNQNIKSIGITTCGHTSVLFGSQQIQLLKKLNIAENAVTNATLTSDANGNASWQTNNQHDAFIWNSIYSNLNVATNNNEANITYAHQQTNAAITLAKESNAPISNFDLYIKNKTAAGFTIYSNDFMYKSLLSGSIGDYTTVQLTSGGIGICYYNVDVDRMQYIYSQDAKHTSFSAPIVIDDISSVGQVSMCLVGVYPAIAYIADNNNNDEWRYIVAKDIYGTTWHMPITLATSSVDVTFSPVSLFIRVVDNVPAIFLSNQDGRAQMYKAKDATGTMWDTVINISNLTNHQILDVQIINGRPAVVAKSNVVNNLYYVQSHDQGNTWPIGATQIYKQDGTPLYTNDGKCCNTMGIINNKLTIVASELTTNILYTATANDINGTTWGNYIYLAPTNTTNAYPRIFQNNTTIYMIYNNTTGSTSEKKLIEFTSTGIKITDDFISTLRLCGDNQIIQNKSDGNNIIIMASEKQLSLLKFYGNDLRINWHAMC